MWMILVRILVRCVYKMFILLRTMLRCKSCLKTIETNKAEFEDATEDNVEDLNEDACNVYAYDFLTL